MAEENGCDLVEVAPDADPPVCRIQDYKKYLYEQRKKQRDSRKKQKHQELKEVKMRPNIDDHDFEMKINRMINFMQHGNKCKVTLQFFGRQIQFRDRGYEIFKKITAMVEEFGTPDSAPSAQGRFMIVIYSPTAAALKEMKKLQKAGEKQKVVDHRHKHDIKHEQRQHQEEHGEDSEDDEISTDSADAQIEEKEVEGHAEN